MKTIIAGSRDITDMNVVLAAINGISWHITEVVSGGARGVDKLGEAWAQHHGIPIKQFLVTPQEWKTIGKSAGHRRNRKMGDYAEALVAVWDGVSPGTKGMIEYARSKGLRVYVHRVVMP